MTSLCYNQGENQPYTTMAVKVRESMRKYASNKEIVTISLPLPDIS